VNSVDLKNRLSDIETNCRDRLHAWLLRIVGASTAPTSMALPCRWRSRPQHQKRTNAPQQIASLFDYLVGAGEQCVTHPQPRRPCGLEIDHGLVLGRRLPWQVAGLLAPEDAIHVAGRQPVLLS